MNHVLRMCIATLSLAVLTQSAMSDALHHEAFTYQGQLQVNGEAVTEAVDLGFRLYDAAEGGNQIGDHLDAADFDAFDESGRFTIDLAFGQEVFEGGPVWLEIEVNGTALSPRQPVMPAPLAQVALRPWRIDGSAAYFTGGNVGVSTALPRKQLSIGAHLDLYSGSVSNPTRPSIRASSAGNLILNAIDNGATYINNDGGSGGVRFHNGTGAGAGGELMRLTPDGRLGIGTNNPDAPLHVLGSVVTGDAGNVASGTNSFVSGGVAGGSNVASGTFSFVGGGWNNTAGGEFSFVGGGSHNTAISNRSFVGGGEFNTVSGFISFVGGGNQNTASGGRSFVGGGQANTASGSRSFVGGGWNNTASGSRSFAAGYRAKAVHDGSFVWADSSTHGDVSSTAPHQFIARATGGVRFYTTSNQQFGAYLPPNGSFWQSFSDRNAKENFESVDGREVLRRVIAMPITTWNYKEQNESIRHMGPMAQDFWSAFGLGEEELYINSINTDGVAFAAIQGLHDLVLERDAAIEALRSEKDAEVAELRQENDALRARLDRIERTLQSLNP